MTGREREVEIDHAIVQRWVVKQSLNKAIDNNGVPEKITIGGSAANKLPALEEYNIQKH